MKFNNILEIKQKRAEISKRNLEIINLIKAETREMSDEEKEEFDKNEEELKELDENEKELEEEKEQNLDEIEDKENRNKNTQNHINMKKNIVTEIRSAMENGTKSFTINAEKRAVQVTGGAGVGVHNPATATADGDVVETEIQGILDPLYAESVLAKLGVKFYTGLPHGDVSIPVMGKGNVGWASEIGQAVASNNTFKNILMTPKRLTAYVDISKQLLNQDTIGVEQAIRRDIVNALNDKLEATILGDAAATQTQPAGIFATGILGAATAVTDFKGVCENEAKVETANVSGEMKYLMNPSAKAALRAMAKSTKSTELVLQGGEVDGVPAVVTSNVKNSASDKLAVYGNFSNLAVASWGDIEIVIDEYTQALNGCLRLVINAYFDCAVLRPEAFNVITL